MMHTEQISTPQTTENWVNNRFGDQIILIHHLKSIPQKRLRIQHHQGKCTSSESPKFFLGINWCFGRYVQSIRLIDT